MMEPLTVICPQIEENPRLSAVLAYALEETVQSDGEARDAGAVQGADHRRSDFTEKLFHTA